MSPNPPFHPFRATFQDEVLEREFQRENYAQSTRAFVTFSVALGSIAFLAYGLHDRFVLPASYETAWKIRYGVFLPVATLVLLSLRAKDLGRWLQPVVLAFGASTTLVALWIGAIASGPAALIYTCFAPLFVIMGPFLVRMSVTTELAFTGLTLLFYLGFDAALVHADPTVRLSITATLLTMGGIGALIAYQHAHQSRQSFLQRRTIQRQITALDEEKRRSEELLLNVLPPAIAERLKSSNAAIADGFAEVSVLFADIVGFTGMSERVAPAALVERLNEVFSAFDDLAEKLRLEKIKTIGDAYMVAGGLNLERHDHAEALAEMALAMLRRMEGFSDTFGERLNLRIGIHTGPAVAGVIGKKKFIYDVWGDTVNTASRMESHGEPGTIHVTESVHTRLREKYDFTARGEIDVKGKGKMRTFYLTGRRGVSIAKTRLPWET
ncbi:MAG TPA: adenylate/guanylate cyclase domain-containing protein [Polyangiaceae bacterium]